MNKYTKVSLVINTLNEEATIRECIESVGDFCDEIVVCDMRSNDKTCEIAQALGAKVITIDPQPFVDGARLFAIEQARGEWVLVLDADERATPDLLAELSKCVGENDVDVVDIRMDHLFMGKYLKHGIWGRSLKQRFFKRSVYLENTPTSMIPVLHSSFPGLKACGNRLTAKGRIVHLAYPDFRKYTYKTLYHYSAVDAQDKYNRGEKINILDFIWKPLKTFLISYLWLQGYKDKMLGFISSVSLAIHSFLIVVHQYELQMLGEKHVTP